MVFWQSTLEIMALSDTFWKGKRVFLTGHTGFKGAWLTLLLKQLGAEVYGYSREVMSSPNFFMLCNIIQDLQQHTIGDIRNKEAKDTETSIDHIYNNNVHLTYTNCLTYTNEKALEFSKLNLSDHYPYLTTFKINN